MKEKSSPSWIQMWIQSFISLKMKRTFHIIRYSEHFTRSHHLQGPSYWAFTIDCASINYEIFSISWMYNIVHALWYIYIVYAIPYADWHWIMFGARSFFLSVSPVLFGQISCGVLGGSKSNWYEYYERSVNIVRIISPSLCMHLESFIRSWFMLPA